MTFIIMIIVVLMNIIIYFLINANVKGCNIFEFEWSINEISFFKLLIIDHYKGSEISKQIWKLIRWNR